MTMQYDVKSVHKSSSGVAVGYRTRLKGAVVSANAAAAARNMIFANNFSQAGTYGRSTTTVTVTMAAHGLVTGDRVWLSFAAGSGGTATANVYTVTVTNSSTFTVTDTSSGTITGTPWLLCTPISCWKLTRTTPWRSTWLSPGEGILAPDGIYVGLVTNLTATVFYG